MSVCVCRSEIILKLILIECFCACGNARALMILVIRSDLVCERNIRSTTREHRAPYLSESIFYFLNSTNFEYSRLYDLGNRSTIWPCNNLSQSQTWPNLFIKELWKKIHNFDLFFAKFSLKLFDSKHKQTDHEYTYFAKISHC